MGSIEGNNGYQAEVLNFKRNQLTTAQLYDTYHRRKWQGIVLGLALLKYLLVNLLAQFRVKALFVND